MSPPRIGTVDTLFGLELAKSLTQDEHDCCRDGQAQGADAADDVEHENQRAGQVLHARGDVGVQAGGRTGREIGDQEGDAGNGQGDDESDEIERTPQARLHHAILDDLGGITRVDRHP
jgi:hypothetical protein